MATGQDNKILIMGAGLAGLALAQFLRKQGIPSLVFERDADAGSRKQGWALVLIECLAACDEMLPDDVVDLKPTSVNSNIHVDDEWAIYDIVNDKPIMKMGNVPKGQPGYVLRAGREALRHHLWHGVDVVPGKNFMHYREDAHGVEAFFADGTSYRGSAIVGADGAHSHVRRQLLEHLPHEAVLSQFIPLWGDLTLTPEQSAPLHAIANAYIVGAQPHARFMIGQRTIAADRSSSDWYWNISFKSDNPARDSAWASHASKQELYDRARTYSEAWPPSLAPVIQQYSSPESMSTPPLKMYEFVPPEPFPRGRVTLIGDALHAMIPFRAGGANTAILDSADLAKIFIRERDRLTTTATTTDQWADMFKEYETVAIPRGRDMVLSSRAAGEEEDSGLQRITQGRVMNEVK